MQLPNISNTTPPSRKKLLVETLEKRILYSADAAALLTGTQDLATEAEVRVIEPVNSQQTNTQNQNQTIQQRHEIVFVDESVDGYEALVNDLLNNGDNRTFEIYTINNNEGIDQIAKSLASVDNIDAIHIIAHGDAGQIQIGNATITNNSFQQFSQTLSTWSNALDSEADILFYGCNVAATEDGQQLLAKIADTTEADIAASTDLTGNVNEGGDWILEYHHGQLETEVAISEQVQAQFTGTLAVTSFENGVNGYAGTQDTYIDSVFADFSYGNFSTAVYAEGTRQQALLRFDDIIGAGGSQIPSGAQIVSATITFEVILTDAFDTVSVHKMLTNWSEASTWNSLSNGVSTDNVEAAASATTVLDASIGGITNVDVTADVQAYADGETNYGWVFINSSDDGSLWTFDPSEDFIGQIPVLTVNYTMPPVIDLDADNSSGATGRDYNGAFVEDGGAVTVVDSDATLTDLDSGNLQSMTVTITNQSDGWEEWLSADTTGTSITSSYDPDVGMLSLTGTDTVANYQQVLRTVEYINLSHAPDTTTRVINFQANDGTSNSNIATSNITITATQDSPINLYTIPSISDADVMGYYSFDSDSNYGRDDAGDDNPITLYGSPITTSNLAGGVASDGLFLLGGEYGELTTLGTTGGAMSISGWVSFDSTDSWARVFDFGQTDSTGIGNIYVARESTTNNLAFTIEKNGVYTHRATAVGAITNATWMHFAATAGKWC